MTLLSCEPEREHSIPPGKVEFSLPTGLSGENLRYAVAWTLLTGNEQFDEGDLVIGSDGAIEASSFTVRFKYLQPRRQVSLLEGLYIESDHALEVYRPRIIIYEDVNRDGALDIDFADTGDGDPILALDSANATTVAVILDLEAQLSKLPRSALATYYEHTGNQLTPFVWVNGGYGALSLASMPAPGFSYPLPPAAARTALLCPGRPSAGVSVQRRVYFDESVSAAEACGIFGPCVQTDLAKLPLDDNGLPLADSDPSPDRTGLDGGSPALSDASTSSDEPTSREVRDAGTSAAHALPVQCKLVGDLAVLLVLKPDSLSCETCRCTSEESVYLVRASESPDWWPCGSELEYCESAGPLYTFDPACADASEQ